ncbi:MAG: hypothetical protein Q7J38_15635 [Gallionella sp.]|nr:hypothetical protein [Gallionella sp.]
MMGIALLNPSYAGRPKTAAKSLVIPQAGEGANESLRKFHVNESGHIRL